MAVNTEINRIAYAGNGSSTALSFPYYVKNAADLVVIDRVEATGVETVKTITTHYTVSLLTFGATVTMLSAPATGHSTIIYNDPARTQDDTLVENESFPAETQEDALNKLTVFAQRDKSRLDRAVRLTDGNTQTFDPKLPALIEADTVFVVNPTATGFVAVATADFVGATGSQGPAGADGADGADGAPGADGADGVGVPAGGTANQALTKINSTDYNTQWATIDKSFVGLGNVDNTSDATKNAASVTLTNKTLTSPVINSPTGIVKGDVGLGNVDNTSDATKNSAVATLTNKTLTSPTIAKIGNLTSDGYVKTSGADGTLGVSSPTTAFAELYKTIATASGDLVYGGASGTPTRLAKGSDTQVLTLASGVPTWAAAGGGTTPGSYSYAGHATPGSSSNFWFWSSTTFTTPTKSGTQPTWNIDKNSNFGTVTFSSTTASWSFTAPRAGDIEITVTPMVQAQTALAVLETRLKENGSGTVLGYCSIQGTSAANIPMPTSGVITVTNGQSIVLNLEGKRDTGNMYIGQMDCQTILNLKMKYIN